MKRNRHVKIVATLGPASNTYEMIRKLHEAGADVFRLNMSHGSHEEIRVRHAMIRQVEEDLGSPICILADLQGPKLRVGVFKNGEEMLEVGASFRLDLNDDEGDVNRVKLPHKEIFDALEPGAHLLVNDGKIKLRVKACGADFADCEVIVGGMISNRKGVNVPDVILPLAALSDKDRKDLEFVCELGVDWLALSFVQRAADVEEARALLAGATIRRVRIDWKEDVRHWHPGQQWIWQAGGLGVFDPGINALSILTRILPDPVFPLSALLEVPENCQAPIAARLSLQTSRGAPVEAEFDWRQTGPQTWDIHVETDGPEVLLREGGAKLFVDGAARISAEDREYRRLYARFAELIAAGQRDVDLAPLQLVADAFLLGERQMTEPFHD